MTGLSPANENLWGTVGVHCVQIFALHALDQETGSDCCLPLGNPPIVSGFLGKIFAPLHRQLSCGKSHICHLCLPAAGKYLK